MMRFPRATIALATLAIALVGCSTSTTNKSSSTKSGSEQSSSVATALPSDLPKGDNTKTIYLVSKGFQHQYWQAVKKGAEKAGKEYGYIVRFVGPDDETKITQQIDQLTTALTSNPAAIGIAALDAKAVNPVLKKIKDKNIPVVAFDSGVDSEIPLTTVSTDNKAAAAEAAKKMVELTGGKGTVGVVCHDQTSATGQERCAGFIDYMKAKAPGIKLLPQQYAGEVGLAANTAKSLITANPDVVGIYGSNEAAAGGVVQGVAESGKKLIIVGFDSGKVQLDAIRKGKENGAITQSPVKMGYETVQAAIAAINHKPLPKKLDSGFAWYDKNNMNDPEIKQNLYE